MKIVKSKCASCINRNRSPRANVEPTPPICDKCWKTAERVAVYYTEYKRDPDVTADQWGFVEINVPDGPAMPKW